MRWTELLSAVGTAPLFEVGTLLVGGVDARDVRRQLSRWTASGDLVQLRRGLYSFGRPWAEARRPIDAFEVANRMVRGSYVSLTSELSAAGLIPEYVPAVTSITTGRPQVIRNPIGTFIYRHVRDDLFRGYEERPIAGGVSVYVALPEKALVDMLYLSPRPDDAAFLRQLRLQNLDTLRLDRLVQMAQWTRSGPVARAVDRIIDAVSRGEEVS